GPRPERPVFIETFRTKLPGYMLRHRIPAGLTGWAQVQGYRGDTDLAARLRLDLAYLERWSLLLDVEIILRTVWHVLSGRNAV
ncbi:MAG: sugar transferase, partial [Planctomycetota bacterium]